MLSFPTPAEKPSSQGRAAPSSLRPLALKSLVMTIYSPLMVMSPVQRPAPIHPDLRGSGAANGRLQSKACGWLLEVLRRPRTPCTYIYIYTCKASVHAKSWNCPLVPGIPATGFGGKFSCGRFRLKRCSVHASFAWGSVKVPELSTNCNLVKIYGCLGRFSRPHTSGEC